MTTKDELNELHKRLDGIIKLIESGQKLSDKRTAEFERALAEHQRTIAEIKRELGALSSKHEPITKTVHVGRVLDEPSVIIRPVAEAAPPSSLPSPGEYRQLLRLVGSKYAQFAGDNVTLDEFVTAFQFLAVCGRYHSWAKRDWADWMHDCNQWVRGTGNLIIHSYAAIGAAVVAHDDIPRTSFSDFPRGGDVMLIRHGGIKTTGKAWRKALETGRLSLVEASSDNITDRSMGWQLAAAQRMVGAR